MCVYVTVHGKRDLRVVCAYFIVYANKRKMAGSTVKPAQSDTSLNRQMPKPTLNSRHR